MQSRNGFSLMELMTVIAIIGILSAIAVPNVISWRNNAQVNSAARDLYSAFQLAKSAAAKNNMNCTIAFDEKADDGDIYDFVIFLENQISPDLKYTAGETVLKKINFSNYGGVKLYNSGFSSENADAVTFRPDGRPIVLITEEDGDIVEALGGGSVAITGSIDKTIKLTNAGSIQIIDG